jgi:hypothetical protein
MDPASAIGIASGAISFVQFSYQFLCVIYDAYDGTKQGTYEGLGDVAEQMKIKSVELLSQYQTSNLSQSNVAFTSLANQCYKLATDLVKHVNQTKSSNRSLRSAINAAVKTLLNQGEISRLQAALDNCRSQLHLQFDLSSR